MNDNFTYMEHTPAERTKTKFGIRGHLADVVICFRFMSREGPNLRFPLMTVVFTTDWHYHAACHWFSVTART